MSSLSDSPDSRREEGDRTAVALLRGVNVGGKNKLPMAGLRSLAEALGWRDVRTYIQSGNLIFRPPEDSRADPGDDLAASLEKAIAEALPFRAPVIVRSGRELARIVAGNPFLGARGEGLPPYGEDENKALHVGFLAASPAPERIASLDLDRSPPDAFSVVGREIYLHTPGGLARTKLTNAYFDSSLATVTTVRNWRTVHKLLAMTRE